jgi:heme exporter protein C
VNRNKLTLGFLSLGGVLTLAAFIMAFFYSPVAVLDDGIRPDVSFQIFYFHVPMAEASFLVFAVAAFYSLRFLLKKDRLQDVKARIGMEVTLMFVILTMVTGDLWTKARWGVWWEWEPRLTTYFLMTLLVIGYFVLRNSIEDEERRATYAAVFGIIAFLDAPISFFITRVAQSGTAGGVGNHPIVFGGSGGLGTTPQALITFIVAQVGMLMLGYALFQLRMREETLKERLESAKISLGG